MGPYSRNNDSDYANNTAAELQDAIDTGNNRKKHQLLNHMTAEGDPASAAATIDALRRLYSN
jgi:hypothetical protein